MIDKIKAHVNLAFRDAPKTKRVQELKEELLSNLIEKYNDQLVAGKTEDEAYHIAITSIGDIHELVESLHEPVGSKQPDKTYASIVAITTAMFILSPVVLIASTIFGGNPVGGLLLMLTLIALAAGLRVYIGLMRPKYTRADESMVEEFKEWRATTSSRKQAYKSFKSAYWSLVVAVYLLLSFLFGVWAFSWIIFIIAAAVENIVKGILELRSDQDA